MKCTVFKRINFINSEALKSLSGSQRFGDSWNKQLPSNNPPTRTHVDVTGDDGDILEVQRGVDLVHEVERRGLVVVQREHQCQGAERLLSSGQVEDLLPALLRRAHAVGGGPDPSERTHTKGGVAQRIGGSCYLNMMPSENGSRLSTSSSSASPPSVSIW